ncbi:FecCD family ABC transporter permease [Vibrio parahaemolyticus]|uniref:FecCD family ABC transporter permease n=1 Tax=Vibrio parahaemolyticus TaxID=670 RepID=UPI0005425DDD|nr:iron chelate uptake ABC transporter family permease subunit [Vibrio parahaemolyticus]EIY8171677.1 iron chelate uptake ABC transporter family permease subunit [Vibrio parahaemolyticus]EIY8250177.1 iron chelate uptake ABC transporter family permease subunit [Vibrio parahaemolyticus]ELA9410187.1 iron chelate uptake ABC transporter family permease subunit [Vibrio parahaemolyticus]ELA9437322.1 iron chelate uptake ABC transporter family permease subunit [Vibrio parahaemolyticus]KHF11699.1 iron-di
MMNQTKLMALLGLLLIASSLTLFVGAANLSAQQVFALLFSFSDSDFVIHQYRLPRMLLAIGVGAGLGLSGVLVQGVIRNPLASPDLMGISAGAGLAATACLVLYPNAPVAMLPMVAMAGGLLAAGFTAVLAYWSKPTPARLALIGVAVSAFLASGIDFLLIVNPIEINTAMVWLTGSLWGRNWQQVPFIWSALLLLLPLAFWLAWRLDVMGLGEESATTLGTKPRQIQILALIAAVLLASISVSVAGTISFVGLLSPHLARLLFGHNHKLLIPASATLGALLVICADGLARGLQPPIELPAGVLTSVIGAPYFIFLLYRYRGW